MKLKSWKIEETKLAQRAANGPTWMPHNDHSSGDLPKMRLSSVIIWLCIQSFWHRDICDIQCMQTLSEISARGTTGSTLKVTPKMEIWQWATAKKTIHEIFIARTEGEIQEYARRVCDPERGRQCDQKQILMQHRQALWFYRLLMRI